MPADGSGALRCGREGVSGHPPDKKPKHDRRDEGVVGSVGTRYSGVEVKVPDSRRDQRFSDGIVGLGVRGLQ